MSSLFDFDAPPDRYAVMGNPVSHSLSPAIHAEFARQTGQRLVYEAIQVDEGGFEQAAGNFSAAGGKGLNVTVPFKRVAWDWVERRSARAERAGAVNTIRFDADATFGDNTDGVGLVRDITLNLDAAITGRRVLIAGAGGAVRGVLAPILEQGPRELVITNRSVDKALELAEQFSDAVSRVSACSFEALAGREFDLIINGTAASLHGAELPLPPSVLAPGCVCYDMMYAARPTPFLRWAQAHGAARAVDGLGMLVEQAAESFFLWRGVRPETAPVIVKMRALLSSRAG
ncbi:MAG: shikimate dehydrogenase [Gammaproteobacteria bacterium]|nr:shikimate dehydrogenase [Gammaproteobacteria bacterium]